MMGSSYSKEITTLDAVLAIVTNPDMLAKNIEALKAKILEAQEATRIAREEQDKTTVLVKDIRTKEESLAPREVTVKQKEDTLEANQKALSQALAAHADELKQLENDKKTHQDNLRIFDKTKSDFQAVVSRHEQKVKDDSDRLAKRESDVKAREDLATTREEHNAREHDKIRDKADKLRKLAE